MIGALAIAAFAWVSSPLWLHYLPDSVVYFGDLRGARQVIKQIDEFRRTKGVLPVDLCAFHLRCDESAPLHYNTTKDGYALWFGTPTHGFFSALVYESDTRSWHISAD